MIHYDPCLICIKPLGFGDNSLLILQVTVDNDLPKLPVSADYGPPKTPGNVVNGPVFVKESKD